MNEGPIIPWAEFIQELQNEILPVYQAHEQHFDWAGIHGRMHICRAVIFAECMGRCYSMHAAQPVDYFAVRTAAAFHDSGRQGNGPDLWEKDSSRVCFEYVQSKIDDKTYTHYVAQLILKPGAYDLNKRIVHDADVLEIMRPCCGHGGYSGFRPKHLRFAGPGDSLAILLPNAAELREQMVQEAWSWIQETERLKPALSEASDYMEQLLALLQSKKLDYPFLAAILAKPKEDRHA